MSNSLSVTGSPECCVAPSSKPITSKRAEATAPLLKALADPVRLRLMSMIAAHDGGEVCVCELLPAFDLSQPTISYHLKVLHSAGLVDCERRGTWVYYRARPSALATLSLTVAGLTG